MVTKNARTRCVGVVLAMTLALAIAPAVVFGQTRADDRAVASPEGESGNGLEGVWQTVVTFRDCQTGLPFGSFQALRTFATGGTLSETNPSFPGSGHGVWKRTSGRQYTVGLAFYAYGPSGELAGNADIKEYIRLRRDFNSYTSYSTFQFVDPNGNVIDAGCSTEAATRFPF